MKTRVCIVIFLILFNFYYSAFSKRELTILDINPPMCKKIMEAQNLRSQGDMTKAIIKYREAMNLANINNPIEFESYIHCKLSIAGIYTYGTIFGKFSAPEPTSKETLWDKAIKEYEELLNEIKGKENRCKNKEDPNFYCTKKGAQFFLAILYGIKGNEKKYQSILYSLDTELTPFIEIGDKLKAGDKSIYDKMITLGDSGITTKTQNISPIALHILYYFSKEVKQEIQNKRRTDILLHPEKYPIIKK
jgi:tetratricopeptide (TPR) repeat protein